MASPERTGYLVAGQDAGSVIDRRWQEVISETHCRAVDEAFGIRGGPGAWELLGTLPTEREVSALSAHLLLATLVSHLSERLPTSGVVVSGHSAGLAPSLIFTDFYRGGWPDMALIMGWRGQLLDQAPGTMHAVLWNGPQGFARVDELVAEQEHKEVWVACYNYEGDQRAQVVLTAADGVDVEGLCRQQGQLTYLRQLKIAIGAHCPQLETSAMRFQEKLLGLKGERRLGNLTEDHFVSDHVIPGGEQISLTSDGQEIVMALASFHKPVRFQEMVIAMVEEGQVGRIVEIGSAVLGGMIRWMPLDTRVEVFSLVVPKDLNGVESKLANIAEV